MGRHLAIHFAKRGANLVLAGRSLDHLKETAAIIETSAPAVKIFTLIVDLTRPDSIEAFLDALASLNVPVRALICTAAGFYKGSFGDLSASSLADLIAANYGGVVNVILGLLRRVPRSSPLDIVPFTSVSAATTLETGRSSSAHIATKAALQLFSIVVGRELSTQGVRITTMAPGTFGRGGRPGISEGTMAECVQFIIDLPPDAWIETIALRPTAASQ